MLCSDNQALKEIFHPDKNTLKISSTRLQRWALLLSIYDYEFKHKPAKEMTHVDALSRLPLNEATNIKSISLCYEKFPIDIDVIKMHVKEDSCLSKFMLYLLNGHIEEFDILVHENSDFKYYFKLKNEFYCEEGLLYYRDRIVIPKSLQIKILELMHEGHDGIVKTKQNVRSYFWWKNLDKDIENYVKTCFVCQSCANVPRKEKLAKWKPAEFPFERVHLDFFYFEGKNFLILVDAYSRFMEVWLMNKTDARHVRNVLMKFFSVFGLPSLVVADNGPPFNSQEIREILENNAIKYKNSPPHHPQSNGLAERAVQTIKDKLKKFTVDAKYRNLDIQEKLDLILMSYRNTPTSVSKAPSKLIFKFVPRTLINSINKKIVSNDIQIDQLDRNKQKIVIKEKSGIGNQTHTFKKGEKVLYRLHFKDFVKWKPAIVIDILSNFTYKIKIEYSERIVHANQLRKSMLDDKYYKIINNSISTSQMANSNNNENEKPLEQHFNSNLEIPNKSINTTDSNEMDVGMEQSPGPSKIILRENQHKRNSTKRKRPLDESMEISELRRSKRNKVPLKRFQIDP